MWPGSTLLTNNSKWPTNEKMSQSLYKTKRTFSIQILNLFIQWIFVCTQSAYSVLKWSVCLRHYLSNHYFNTSCCIFSHIFQIIHQKLYPKSQPQQTDKSAYLYEFPRCLTSISNRSSQTSYFLDFLLSVGFLLRRENIIFFKKCIWKYHTAICA